MPLPQAVEIRVTGTGTRITVVDRVARALAREGLVWVSADTTADLETMPGITFERLAARAAELAAAPAHHACPDCGFVHPVAGG